MSLDSLEGMLVHEMSDLLSAENQFAKALAQVARSADSATVRDMAQQHHEETRQQAENLKQALGLLGRKPEKGLVCQGAQGIVQENSSTLKDEKPKGAFKDLALVSGSLRIEHYEIAGYSAAIALAKAVGNRQVTQILQTNLKQEQATAKKLEQAAPQLLQMAGASASSATSGSATSGSATSSANGTATVASSASSSAPARAAKKAPAAKAPTAKASAAKAPAATASRGARTKRAA